MRSGTLATTVAVLAMTLSACGGADPSVRQATVEQMVSDQLEEEVGAKPDAIDCPGDLAGTVDTTMRCTLTAGPDTLGVTLTVTSVDGRQVDFDIEVDEQ